MNAVTKLTGIAVIGAALGLTACASNPYGTNQPYGTTNQGSATAATNGALAGAAIGALAQSDGNRKDIAKGAAIGAAAGGVTGYALSTSPNYPYQR